MPFYEYQCQACSAQVEVLQKISDAPLKKCPECGKSRLQKLISAPSFRLAGGGWYETDFKTDKDKQRNLVEAEKGESRSEDKAETKVETKADTKADAKVEAKSEAKPEAKPEAKSAPKSEPGAAARPMKKKAPATPVKRKSRR